MKVITADLVPSTTFDGYPDMWETSGVEYQMYSRYQRSEIRASLFYAGPQGECRQKFGGPYLPGPYASVITKPWIIAKHPVDPVPRVEHLEPGDVVIFHGQPMALREERERNPYFVPLPTVNVSQVTQVMRRVLYLFSGWLYDNSFDPEPVLFDWTHENLVPGEWSINWEPHPEEWVKTVAEDLWRDPISGIKVEPVNECILHIYPDMDTEKTDD